MSGSNIMTDKISAFLPEYEQFSVEKYEKVGAK